MRIALFARLVAPVLAASLLAGAARSGREEAGPPPTRSALEPFVERGEIAGAVVLIADGDMVLEHYAIGYADVAGRRPMPEDGLFWIASTGKPFVGTAVMMLVEERRIGLDDPVSKYLPGFDPQVAVTPEDPANTVTRPAQHEVTVRMLLNHTSGMYSVSAADAPTLDARPLAERVASYGKLLQFEPGTRFWYGNADVNTAAYVVEVVSGMPFEEFLATRLFDPLGMKDTGFCPSSAQLEKLPTAYTDGEAEGIDLVALQIPSLHYPLDDCANRYPVPAGGLFSTAADLARFARMLLGGGTLDGRRYLSQGSIDEMTRGQLPEELQQTIPGSGPPDHVSYGLAWGVSRAGAYFHPGTGMTDIIVDPTHRIATILLMQSTSPASFPARAALIAASEAQYAPRVR